MPRLHARLASRLEELVSGLLGAVGNKRQRRFRLERFGGIVQLSWPRALLFVDRQYMREIGIDGGRIWEGEEPPVGKLPLEAPLEAHLQITNRCDAACKGCYTAASPKARQDWGLEEWKQSIDVLAEMGVFHLALGGGESADLPWLGDLVHYARDKGLVPNLTTSGLSNLDRVLSLAPYFGQINISIDGLRDNYKKVRGFDGFAQADAALRALRERTSAVGINVVVTRHNFEELATLFEYARYRRLNEVELLRFKPAGRGIQAFRDMACTDEQHRRFLPAVLAGAKKSRMRIRVDCSYTPMLAHHKPSEELLRRLSVYGCTGGDFLIGAKATGQVTACSFAPPPFEGPKVSELHDYWHRRDAFGVFRRWQEAAEPCKSCDYLSLCRGGCRVVSQHLCGSDAAPDPECPRVIDHGREQGRKSLPVFG